MLRLTSTADIKRGNWRQQGVPHWLHRTRSAVIGRLYYEVTASALWRGSPPSVQMFCQTDTRSQSNSFIPLRCVTGPAEGRGRKGEGACPRQCRRPLKAYGSTASWRLLGGLVCRVVVVCCCVSLCVVVVCCKETSAAAARRVESAAVGRVTAAAPFHCVAALKEPQKQGCFAVTLRRC